MLGVLLRALRGELFDRTSRHDVDLVDHDALSRLTHFAHAVLGHGRITDFSQHIIAFNQFAERRVLMIEPVHRC